MMIDPRLFDAGEALIWSGRPGALSYARKKSWYAFLFGLVFLSFALFWVHGAWAQGKAKGVAENYFWLFGTPFVLADAGMVLSPVWYLFRGMRTQYALTDRRAVIFVSGPFGRTFSVPLSQARFTEVRRSSGSSGDIYFDETAYQAGMHMSTRREGFLAIPDVDRVDQLLRQGIEKASSVVARRS